MSDIEIANRYMEEDIISIAKKIDLSSDDLICYGRNKAKITKKSGSKNGKLVLVTAINPTVYGEGKTTVSIGLVDALRKSGNAAIGVLRQPSMGPVFGTKGGATGGGYSQVVPMSDINLHFTGDFHAISAANNLLCAAIDNHIYQGNSLGIKEVCFQRCLDVNDRALREVKVSNREEKFDITAASEIMALFCLATSLDDLKNRLGNILVGLSYENKEIYAKDLHIEGALTVILKDAFYPNLVQTLEGSPVIIHGGPFANIAHGCNSVVATKLGLSLADYVITEAGFGADLGALKFFDIKCRKNNLKPDAVVLVVTTKALKYNAYADKENINKENVLKVREGLANLEAHLDNLEKFGVNVLVCLNKYENDSDLEIQEIENYCLSRGVEFSVSRAYSLGGEGAIDLAETLLKVLEKDSNFHLLYDVNISLKEKIKVICKEIYHASNLEYSDIALEKITDLEEKNMANLPICVAKTQYSLSDDAKKLGYPRDYTIHIKDIKLYNGAAFITVYMGNIMTMPGLGKRPNYEQITLDSENKIIGIF